MTDILGRRLAPSSDAVESKVGDETVILHLTKGTYYGLDAIGTRIWTLIKQEVKTADICQQIADEYGMPIDTIEADARCFLEDLEAQGILVNG